MKRLAKALDVGPKYAADFARAGIENVKDLAAVNDPAEVSRQTGIPLSLVKAWHQQARHKIKLSRQRRRIAVVVLAVAFGIFVAVYWLYTRPARAYAQAGVAYDQKDYKQALALYERAIRLDPNYESAWANKGGVLEVLGRHEEALAALNKALELDPKDWWSYCRRGDVYYGLGKNDEALNDYNTSISLNPNYKYAFRGKSLTFIQQDQSKEAFDVLNTLIARDPNDSWAYSVRGGVYHSGLYDFERAYDDFKKASELEPSSFDHQADLAEATFTSGRFQEAAEQATRLLADDRIKKDTSELMAMRFVVVSTLLMLGNKSEARAKLADFISDYKSVPRDSPPDWIYKGDKYFIEHGEMDSQFKKLTLELISLLEEPEKSTAERIDKLSSYLA